MFKTPSTSSLGIHSEHDDCGRIHITPFLTVPSLRYNMLASRLQIDCRASTVWGARRKQCWCQDSAGVPATCSVLTGSSESCRETGPDSRGLLTKIVSSQFGTILVLAAPVMIHNDNEHPSVGMGVSSGEV